MMKVIFVPEAFAYLEELSYILYYKNYFGSESSSQKYVAELLDLIVANLPTSVRKSAPSYFDRYGSDMSYVTIKKNKQTFWYVFFNEYDVDGEVVCQIRYISNNHMIAQMLLE